MHTIVLSVSYGLREYVSFVRDFGAWHRATKGGKTEFKPGRRSTVARIAHTATAYLLAPPIFVVKKRVVGHCEFSINEDRLLRRSKSGVVELSWKQVRHVYRLTQAYLVQEEGGAMPLPYRAFTQAQLQQFESILEKSSVATFDAR